MTSFYSRTQDLANTTGKVFAPANYLTTYTGVSQNNADTFVLGSLSDANITNSNYTTDSVSTFHQLYSMQVQGSYQSYKVSGWYGMVTLTNTQNGQSIHFQLTQPTGGLNNSGVDVQFLDGGLAFTSNVDNNGTWTTWVTKGGGTNLWGTGSAALPATGLQADLNLSALGTTTVNTADGLNSNPTVGVASTWSNTTGYGQINLDTAIALATGHTITHTPPPAPTTSTLNWGIGATNFQDAWAAGYTGKGVTIALIDDGIDPSNPALNKNLLTSVSTTFAALQDTASGGTGTHGTFVSSQMIAANTGTVSNPSPVSGGAYDAGLMALNAWSYVSGSYQGIQDSVAAGITYAVNNGANVINISLGLQSSSELQIAFQYATSKGVVIAIASGNSGGNIALGYPATVAQTLGNVIAVGASQYTTPGTTPIVTQAPFSQMASSSTPYNYVDAPGANVLGYGLTARTGTAPLDVGSGTSFSAPEVAAEAAVLEQALKQTYPNISQVELAAAVVHDITVGLVGVATNPIPDPYGVSPNPYGAPA